MVKFTPELFANDTFKLLRSLKENQVEVKGAYYIKLSQQEIDDINKMSKLKINKLLRDLIGGDFIYHYQNKRGKYEITENRT